MTWSKLKKYVAVAAASMLVFGTVSCGSEDEVGEDGLREITVGIVPAVDLAPLTYAIDSGLFEAEGLKVETRVTAGGAEAIPALVAGDLDVVFTAYTAVLQARNRGLDVTVVSGSHSNTAAEDTANGLWTQADSDIKTLADLEGKIIAVNTLGSAAHLMVKASLAEIGLDADDYQLLEVPFPEVPAAIEQNLVDAAWVAEPSRAMVITDLNGRFVGSAEDPSRMTTVEELQDVPMAGYAALGDMDPEIKRAFHAAMDAAMKDINEDTSIALDYTEVPENLIDTVAVSTFSQTTVADLERLEGLMVKYELMDEPSDSLDDAVYSP